MPVSGAQSAMQLPMLRSLYQSVIIINLDAQFEPSLPSLSFFSQPDLITAKIKNPDKPWAYSYTVAQALPP